MHLAPTAQRHRLKEACALEPNPQFGGDEQARFIALMDQFMPKWQSHRDVLNRLPVRHESWDY
jgi:hypothetical protein